MAKYILNILLIFLCFIKLEAQTKNAFIAAAEEAMAQNNYNGALVYYDEASKFDKKDASIIYKTASAARHYNAYGYAASKYTYLLDSLKSNDYPDAIYYLGDAYHKLGEYDKAVNYYNLYLSEYSNEDAQLTSKARININACNNAKMLIKNQNQNITVIRMGDDINSPDADFAAISHKGDMYFSSMKYNGTSKDLRYKQVAKTLVKKGIEPSILVPGYINEKESSIANFTFNTAGTKVYYSVCTYVNGWAQQCKLFSGDVDQSGHISNETILPESINSPNTSNTQPSIGLENGKEMLYFVSDRSGGAGGRDIWKSELYQGNLSSPVNVSDINTAGDDITPFLHTASNTLYFSTDGREGFGGFDIFSRSNGEVVLLPAPINTSMNDFYLYLDESGNKGYLTSNRAGSAIQYESYEACCMDIYAVEIKSDINLDVHTFFSGDKSALNGTRICLYDADTGKEIKCVNNPADLNKQSFWSNQTETISS